jgi:hypothetical protein
MAFLNWWNNKLVCFGWLFKPTLSLRKMFKQGFNSNAN